MKNQALCVKIRQFAPRITKIPKRFAEFHLLSVDVEGTLVPEIIFGAFKISFEAFENSVFDNDTYTELIRAQQITVCIEQKLSLPSIPLEHCFLHPDPTIKPMTLFSF